MFKGLTLSMAIVFIIGIPLYGKLQMPLSQFVISIINTVLIIIAFCSIYNVITMVCSDITISTTICILLFVALFIIDGAIGYSILDIEPTIKQYVYDEQGNRSVVSEEPNPNYPGDAKYNLMKAVYLLNPESQATKVQGRDVEYTSEMPIYSIALILVMNIGGIYIFSRKQLK